MEFVLDPQDPQRVRHSMLRCLGYPSTLFNKGSKPDLHFPMVGFYVAVNKAFQGLK